MSSTESILANKSDYPLISVLFLDPIPKEENKLEETCFYSSKEWSAFKLELFIEMPPKSSGSLTSEEKP